MEPLVASAVGVMTAVGVYLLLRLRSFPVVLGVAILSYAVNVFLFATGRLAVNRPPVLSEDASGYTDPLPQALVLTAIVISFGMTAVVLMMALGAYLTSGDDAVEMDPAPENASGGGTDARLQAQSQGPGQSQTQSQAEPARTPEAGR